MENGYTLLEDTEPTDPTAAHGDKVEAFRREYARRKGSPDTFGQTAERLEELTSPQSPSMADLQAALADEAPPEPPALVNGWPKIEVRVSLPEKERWMAYAYQRGETLSEVVRRTMNGIVDEAEEMVGETG